MPSLLSPTGTTRRRFPWIGLGVLILCCVYCTAVLANNGWDVLTFVDIGSRFAEADPTTFWMHGVGSKIKTISAIYTRGLPSERFKFYQCIFKH